MKYVPRSKVFDGLMQKLYEVTERVAEPTIKVEMRRMKGVEFYVNHLDHTILVRFPGMTDWLDFFEIKKLGATKVMQSQILTTLPESKLDEVRKQLKVKNGGAK